MPPNFAASDDPELIRTCYDIADTAAWLAALGDQFDPHTASTAPGRWCAADGAGLEAHRGASILVTTMSTSPAESVYLDNAASMRMRPEAVASIIAAAVAGRESVVVARRRPRRGPPAPGGSAQSIAADLGARPSEVVFTSGGTGRITSPSPGSSPPAVPAIRVAVASSSRPSSTTRSWTRPGAGRGAQGLELVIIGVDEQGFIDLDAARRGRRPW